MDIPKDPIATLLEHGLYSSAQMLVFLTCGCFLVSSPAAIAENTPHPKAESLKWIDGGIYELCIEEEDDRDEIWDVIKTAYPLIANQGGTVSSMLIDRCTWFLRPLRLTTEKIFSKNRKSQKKKRQMQTAPIHNRTCV